MNVSDGSAAYRRCAMGMCVQKCVLNPDEIDCEECIHTYCHRARYEKLITDNKMDQ